MSNFRKFNIYLNDEVVTDIEQIVQYKKLRDLLFKNEGSSDSIEDFIVGCVCHYLRQIKSIEDLSGIKELGRPYQLQNKIKELLDQKHISQQVLSEKTGISPSNISLIVKNKNQPSVDYFLRIWIALECPPIDWLFYRVE